MLTAKHLAVLRAALMFWDEEMSPHDPAIAAPYLSGPIRSGDWIKETVAYLRSQLAVCQIRYVLSLPDGSSLISEQVFESLDQAQAAALSDSALIAALILFQTSE